MSQNTHTIIGPRVYIAVLLALMAGTALTVFASYLDLGFWNPVIALAIASAKMMLVALYFMHLRYSTKLTRLAIIGGFFLFFTLISLTLADYISRAWGNW